MKPFFVSAFDQSLSRSGLLSRLMIFLNDGFVCCHHFLGCFFFFFHKLDKSLKPIPSDRVARLPTTEAERCPSFGPSGSNSHDDVVDASLEDLLFTEALIPSENAHVVAHTLT